MRWHNDCELAKQVPEIDLILGGKLNNFLLFWAQLQKRSRSRSNLKHLNFEFK